MTAEKDLGRPIRIVLVSSLYPNAAQPRHGIFVEERLRSLMATGRVHARVVAPVPWFPSTHPRFGRYAVFAAVPKREFRYGIEILHPRYPVIPRVGMITGPLSMAISVAPTLVRMRKEGFDFDLIDAHYFYPDGIAGARLARRFGRPCVITARGDDILTISKFRLPRRQIQSAAAQAAGLVTVSRSLQKALEALGVSPARVITLRNGVDLTRFAPLEQDEAQNRLGVKGTIWLTVGHLVEPKRVDIAIQALPLVPDVTLLVVGTGPEKRRWHNLARQLDVASRVRFVGHVDHEQLAEYYCAADALVHPSRSEGMPNVVLEALACGTAVIATPVGGIPEVVSGLPAGQLMQEATAEGLLQAWKTVRECALDSENRAARRAYAQHLSWQATSDGQIALFERVLERSGTMSRQVTPV